jgi:hypothetical protein
MIIRILPYGREELSPAALRYVQAMADRHGFKVLERDPDSPSSPFRIEIASTHLKDPVFWAIAEEPK